MRTPDYSNQIARVGNEVVFAARVVRTSFTKGVRKGFAIHKGRAWPVTRGPSGIWETAA